MTKPSEKWTYMGAAPCRLNGVPFTNDMANALIHLCEGDLQAAFDFVGAQCESDDKPPQTVDQDGR